MWHSAQFTQNWGRLLEEEMAGKFFEKVLKQTRKQEASLLGFPPRISAAGPFKGPPERCELGLSAAS